MLLHNHIESIRESATPRPKIPHSTAIHLKERQGGFRFGTHPNATKKAMQTRALHARTAHNQLCAHLNRTVLDHPSCVVEKHPRSIGAHIKDVQSGRR